jgi:hypothetical protein
MVTQMTEDEKIDILMEVVRLKNEGKETESDELFKTYPLEPDMAQIFKDVYGSEFLIEGGYNLSEAEAKFGKEWINQ